MLSAEEFEREYTRTLDKINARLETCCAAARDGTLKEAMRYSLLAGGKRIRPVLLMQFCNAAGGDMDKALPAACAVEMLHTYTLIHDDLPCMDDDALRRGRPSNHIVYGECIATLAGDALQAEAFASLLSTELPGDVVARMGRVFARAAGLNGVCQGQALDMQGESKPLDEAALREIHTLKTSSMLVAAAELGVLAARGNDADVVVDKLTGAATKYATALGLAFQIRDDILDVTGSTDELGKPAGSDSESRKKTFVTLYGIEHCQELVRSKTDEAIAALRGHYANTGFLEALARNLAERKY